jgi:hypothetical protein
MDNLKNQSDWIEDGFGNRWPKCNFGKDCGLAVVRPGKTQCWCDTIEYIGEDYYPDAKNIGWRGEGWYFWSDDRTLLYGPYTSEAKAKELYLKYLKL